MELLERATFLDALGGYLDDAVDRSGRFVFLAGEAGIGKTALVTQFARSAPENIRIAWGACDGLFTPRPLGPLYDIGDELGGEMAAALAQGASRDRLFAATLATLRSIEQPFLVVFEDVHWADEATLDLLRVLGRRADGLRGLVIATYRDDELGPSHALRIVLGDLATSQGVRRMALPPLSVDAVSALIGSEGYDAAELHSLTGGNAFYVVEALAAGLSSVPGTVADAVLARMSRLSSEAQSTIATASFIGQRVEPDVLQSVSPAAPSTLAECVASGLIRVEGDALFFRHELTRRAVASSVPEARATSLHLKILETLERRSGTDPARLAHHAEAAGDGTGVLRHAPVAAVQAARLRAHRESAAQYARVLRFGALLQREERARFLEERSYQCYLTDQIVDAIEVRKAALDAWRAIGDPLRVGDSLRWLSRLLWFLARNEEAERAAEEAVRILEVEPPGAELAMAYSNRSHLEMLKEDTAEAVRWGNRAIDLAEKLGETQTLVHALNNVGSAKLLAGNASGQRELERSLALSLADGLEEHVARAYTNLGSCLVAHRSYDSAAKYIDEGISYSTERDLDSWRLYLTSWEARMHLDRGQFDNALRLADGMLRSAAPPSPISRVNALTVAALVRARRNQPGPALLDEALEIALQTGELQRLAPVRAARAEVAWLRADRAALSEEATDGFDLAGRHDDPWSLGTAAFWMWMAGGLNGVPPTLPPPYEAHISGDLATAARLWRGRGCPYEAAIAEVQTGDPESMRAGFADLEHLGAAATIAALRRDLHSRGVRGVPRGPRPNTRSHPLGLTARESEVLTLMASGLGNADIARELFVSKKTVENHVSVVLAKLGARSRVAAAARARELGLLPQDGGDGVRT